MTRNSKNEDIYFPKLSRFIEIFGKIKFVQCVAFKRGGVKYHPPSPTLMKVKGFVCISYDIPGQGCIFRLLTLDELQYTENVMETDHRGECRD